MKHFLLVISALLLTSWATLGAEASGPAKAKPMGLTHGPNATVLKDGKTYRGIGINYFDCFLRTLKKGEDTSYDAGFATLAAKGIPFARFCATGFWPKDTPEQFTEMLTLANPDPVSGIALHAYEDDDKRFPAAMAVSRKLNKPLFVGEFGAQGETPEQAAKCRRLLQSIVDQEIPLAALWVFDLKSQQDFNVTADNARSWQLDLISEANRSFQPQASPSK